MAANTTPIFPGTVTTDAVRFENADGTTAKTLLTAGASGTRVDAITVTSTDTAARTLTLGLLKGEVTYRIGEIVVPIGAGTNGTEKPADGFTLAIPFIGGSINLEAGCSLTVAAQVAVTAGKAIAVVALGGDY